MSLVGTGRILAPEHHRGVAAFDVVPLEHVEAVVTGAEAAGAPVILQISENTVRYHGGPAPPACAALAARVPVAVHLDHATTTDPVAEAIELGLGPAMFDASTLDYADNVAATADVVGRCHAAEVWVETELGEVGGRDGGHAPGARTAPAKPPTTCGSPVSTRSRWRSPPRTRCRVGTRNWIST